MGGHDANLCYGGVARCDRGPVYLFCGQNISTMASDSTIASFGSHLCYAILFTVSLAHCIAHTPDR